MSKFWPFSTPGIPDDVFKRDKVPMTKEEVRVLTLAKTRLAPGQVVWDIGSGTGSLSIEAALLTPGGTVYAVERNTLGVELGRDNASKIGVDNIVFIQGEAPGVLEKLPDPDRVIIGGSGGYLSQVLQIAMSRLNSGGRLVINAVTMETLTLCNEAMAGKNCDIIQVNISRAVPHGKYRMWQALNPVYIIACEK